MATELRVAVAKAVQCISFPYTSAPRALILKSHSSPTPAPPPADCRTNFEQPTKDGLGADNKGNQMMTQMGWQTGMGLGAQGQGITAPVQVCVCVLRVRRFAHSLVLCVRSFTHSLVLRVHRLLIRVRRFAHSLSLTVG